MLRVYFRSACESVPFCKYVWTVYSLEDAGQGAPGMSHSERAALFSLPALRGIV